MLGIYLNSHACIFEDSESSVHTFMPSPWKRTTDIFYPAPLPVSAFLFKKKKKKS